GWILLSTQEKDQAERIIARLNLEFPERSIDRAVAAQRLSSIREQGCVLVTDPEHPTVARLAMPWHYVRETIPIALEIGVRVADGPQEREQLFEWIRV